jgi:signal transduction histidine kinase/PAS domain-containing protein
MKIVSTLRRRSMRKVSSMMGVNHAPQAHTWDGQPMRRESDRIAPLLAEIRAILLGGGIPGAGTTPAQMPATFLAAAQRAVGLLAVRMSEALIEAWLSDLPPWSDAPDAGDGRPLRLQASAGERLPNAGPRAPDQPEELISLVVTARRPVRLDGVDHPLVRAWAARGGIDPDRVAVFLGLPIAYRGHWLGVLAVALVDAPSVEHIALLDAVAEYLAAGAEHARVLHTLQHQRLLARDALQAIPLAVAVLSAGDFRLMLTNPPFDRMLNCSPDDWGRELDILFPEHGPILRQALHVDDVARTGEPRMLQDLPIRLPGGAMTFWDFTCTPMRDERGAIDSVLLAGMDVTARVAQRERQRRNVDVAQERVSQMLALHQIAQDVTAQFGQDPRELLRAIVQRMAQLVGATGGMVFYADRETGDLEVVVSVGLRRDYTGIRLKRGEGLAGRVAITGQGQYVDDYRQYPLRASQFADEPFGALASVPMQPQGRVLGVISLVHEIPAVPMVDAAGKPARDDDAYHFTSDDLFLLELFANQAGLAIANARTYQDLERMYQQQRAIDREKDDFIARVSHDLRLPLTTLLGPLEVALSVESLPEDLREMIQLAAEGAGQLAEMLDTLLSQARLDSGAREARVGRLRLCTVVEEVVRARSKHSHLHGSPHTFLVQVPGDLFVLADISMLKEALENLISNAVKYSPRGGDIIVAARTETSEDGADRVITTVSDQGIGIPPEARDRLFERFSRIDSPIASEVRGSGMGLYLSRQLLATMNGAIWLESSEPGQGSTFAISLPLARPSNTSEE